MGIMIVPVPIYSNEWEKFYGAYLRWHCRDLREPHSHWPASEVYLYRTLVHLRNEHYSMKKDMKEYEWFERRTAVRKAQEIVCACWHEIRNEHTTQEQWTL